MKKTLILLTLIIALPLQAQNITNKLGGNTVNETYDVTDSNDNLLFRVQGDNGAIFNGTIGIGVIPVSGAGTRMMWYPGQAAFRAGSVSGTEWDAINIGSYSGAFGSNTIADGINSFATGGSTIAIGTNSFATGFFTKAESYSSFALGRYNVGGGNAWTWDGSHPIFEIGIGSSDVSRANAITVLKNGNVGIGDVSPHEKLVVKGNIYVSGTVDGINISTDVTANTAKVTNATHTGDVTGATVLTIGSDKVTEAHLKAVNIPNDEEVLTYETTTGDFEWQALSGGADADWTVASTNMYSAVSGNVGIGTTNPLSKFSVGGDGYNGTVIYGKVLAPYDYGIFIENATSQTGIYSEATSAGWSGYFDGPFYVGGNIGLGTTDFGGGVGIIAIHNALTDPTTALSNAAALYASGGELWAYDASGHTTQLSPHDSESGEWIFYSKNTITGRVVKINMEKLVKKIEEITGESFMEEWVED